MMLARVTDPDDPASRHPIPAFGHSAGSRMIRTSPDNLEYPRHKAPERIGREAARGRGFLLHRTEFRGRKSGAAARPRTYAGNVGTQDDPAQMKII
jgi:hypothetical protein